MKKIEIKDLIYDKEKNITNLYFKDEKLDFFNNIKVGTHFAYEGAFGFTEEKIKNINKKLTKYTPYHHALYIGNGEILQYTGGINNFSFSGIKSAFQNAEVVKDTIDNFKNLAKKKGRLFLIEHDIIDEKENILKRCDEVLGEKKYSFFNNCEDIVNYCLTGEKKSIQRETLINDISETFMNIFKDFKKN